jgi:hypothetical protein
MAEPPTVGVRAFGSFEIVQSQGVRHEAGAWYADPPWRPPGDGLAASGSIPVREELVLLDLGDDLPSRARQRLIPLLARTDGSPSTRLADEVALLRGHLHERLHDLRIPLGDDGPADVIVTPPGHASSSFNFTERRYMGLHVDQHEELPLGGRSRARRLCVLNIGWTHRYLNVHPYRLTDLCRAVGIDPDRDGHRFRSREVTELYFAKNPDAHILRIRLAPGQGYVCNAQDVPHDGSTPEGDTPGIAFHSMGRWPDAD